MNHIVSFSTGLSSALTVERVIEKFGECIVVFMDTTIEDDDNYRFQQEMYGRWQGRDGIEFVWLQEGRTPYQVATDNHIIPNQKIAPCTFKLKIHPFVNWLSERFGSNKKAREDGNLPVTIHIGFDYTEKQRCRSTRKNYEEYGWGVDFPLLWEPYELRKYTEVSRQDWGIEPPRMYAMGYSHANCGGVCVKQGQGDWIRTLINFPDRYAEAEEWERNMRKNPTHAKYALLRDQTIGATDFAKTLETLRLDHERNGVSQRTLFLWDSASACVRCGVGDFVSETRSCL